MIIYLGEKGRLGNKISNISHILSFCLKHDIKFKNFSFDEYAEYFPNFNKYLIKIPLMQLLSHVQFYGFIKVISLIVKCVEKFCTFINKKQTLVKLIEIENKVMKLDQPKFVDDANKVKFLFLFGHGFRDHSNLKLHLHKIRYLFKPHKKYRERPEEIIANIKKTCNVSIGIHIRQGDYRNYLNGKFFFPVESYAEFMNQIKLHFAEYKIGFVVCSDEKIPGDVFHGLHVVNAGMNLVEDFYVLSLCDYIVGVQSTFSEYAALLGGKPLSCISDINKTFDINDFFFTEG